jgi:NADH-quinone oxidoreductase subunit L
MSDISALLLLIPGLPLVAAIVTALLGPKVLKGASHVPTIAAVIGSCAVTIAVLAGTLMTGVERATIGANFYTWFAVDSLPGILPGFEVPFGLEADTLTLTMLVAITFVGSFIAIFSAGYMRGDPGYPRYFAVMSLFFFSMTGLVLANNFLVLYAFWEGVGLCSYLLIGFWFERPSAAAAARKAFLVTRLGDAGMILGIMLLWSKFGHRLDYQGVFQFASAHADSPYLIAACLLLFCGAVGKSAQFPLHVWLPDAMEGPTPVSALIHAATMVTAGVYLVARCTPLFILAPQAQLVVAGIGGITALLAALIALTQTDLKRVLAYSTVSQLGFMFLGLGAGLRNADLAVFAVGAAIFHLFTHAFFKALLFLGAGSVMHAMGHVIDMRRFSGLRKVMPVTHATFACGAAALAGLIPFSGFWSKDEILESLLHAREHSEPFGQVYFVLFLVALFTAALTAFYTFRAYFRTFWGELKVPEEAYHHHDHSEDSHAHEALTDATPSAHSEPISPHGPDEQRSFESPTVITMPLVVLAVGAALVGLLLGPTHLIGDFLAQSTAFRSFTSKPAAHLNWLLIGLSTLSAVAGIAVAWLMYVKQPDLPAKLASSARWAYDLSLNRFRFDEIYDAFIVRPLAGLAAVSRFFDSIVDGIVDLIGYVPRVLGRAVQPVQNGLVQFYALFMMVFVTALLAIFVLWVRQ